MLYHVVTVFRYKILYAPRNRSTSVGPLALACSAYEVDSPVVRLPGAVSRDTVGSSPGLQHLKLLVPRPWALCAMAFGCLAMQACEGAWSRPVTERSSVISVSYGMAYCNTNHLYSYDLQHCSIISMILHVCSVQRRRSSPGMFGKGIYFADCPLKSWRYCFPSGTLNSCNLLSARPGNGECPAQAWLGCMVRRSCEAYREGRLHPDVLGGLGQVAPGGIAKISRIACAAAAISVRRKRRSPS